MKKLVEYVLVTGSEGSVGQFVVNSLYELSSNIRVIRVGRIPHDNLDGRSLYYWGDLTDSQFCSRLFSENKIDYVIACAARWNGINQDAAIFSNNMLLISSLLHAVNTRVKKIVFLSSSAVYHSHPSVMESCAPGDQSSTYGASKLFGEILIEQISHIKKFSYSIYRPFHIVSPAENHRPGSSHVCTDFCHRIISTGERINLDSLIDTPSTGFMWVEDVANIIARNLRNEKTDNHIINIGTREEHNLYDLAAEIMRVARGCGLLADDLATASANYVSRQVDGRFDKLHDLCSPFEITSFTECVRKFILNKYVRERVSEI